MPDDKANNPGRRPRPAPRTPSRRHLSMHAEVEASDDCCSCEAEPRWAALAEEQADGPDEGERRE